ncbi:hypothetical protein Pfo_030960 [Paulownia fortunei]|nr:hypothetical protein Pfo_030960 [Paulownia fortunei]
MAITEYEDQIQSIINEPNHEGFVYDFLSVYEKIPKATITKLRKGLNNLSKEPGEVYLKNKLYFKQTDSDLMQAYVDVQARVNELGTKPRFIIVTDYKQLLAKDTKTHDSLDIEFSKLPQKFEFFLAWNGIEKADFDKENPADVRAAERFAKLYDVVVKDNPHAPRKGLNLFLIRVLFCLFAEDTNIFENNLFTNRVKQMTKEDGTDFDAFVSQLFGVLDFEKSQRPVDTPSWLNDFPYVDGDLFKDPHESLMFSSKSRKLIIDAGELLNWNQVNPDILGSMIQAVASEGSRSHLGMHYTSVPNIMKVIKPLFLDGLREDFETAKGNEDKLQKLYDRIGNIKFMDPACGSGNFLIITYKELRQLEIDILKELNNLGFYGIEIEDFACDVTRLSLWIAEHQMNVKLHEEISDAVRPTLPLQHVGAIVRGNALRLDWNEIFPHMPNDENYIFGNPPYLGSHGSKQKSQHKEDMKIVFSEVKGNYKNLDYIAGWFYLGSEYISNSRAKMAFVATSSITQGIQRSVPINLGTEKTADNYSVVVPKVNTVGREYIAAGVLSSDYIISDLMFSIYDGPLWVLGIIFSKIHYAWIKSVCGSEGDSYRYSKNLGYNTFPLPNISNSRKLRIEDAVMDILDYRDEVGKTPAELYGSPNASKRRIPMDSALLSKHQYLDDVVDRAFSNKSFADDSERMALLLKMYEEKVQSLGK